jgi:glycosyltransferase involved in cell wall biosynthesis
LLKENSFSVPHPQPQLTERLHMDGIVYWFPDGPFGPYPGRPYQLTRRVARTVPVVVIQETISRSAMLPNIQLQPTGEPGLTIAEIELHPMWVALRRRAPTAVSQIIGRGLGRALRQQLGLRSYTFWYAGGNPQDALGLLAGPLLIDLIDPPFVHDSRDHLRARLVQWVPHADQFFATASLLVDEVVRVGGDVALVPNGCDHVPESPAIVPPTPTVGYLGTLDWRFDWALVEQVAMRMPSVRFVMAGRVLVDVQEGALRLRTLSNVEFRDAYGDVRDFGLFNAFSIGIIPFKTGFDGDAINPVKMYEYLAHGLPVLAAPIRECLEREPLVRCARSPEAWVAAINDLLDAPRAGATERMSFARSNTWDDRSAMVIELLRNRGMIPATTQPTTSEDDH